MLHILQKIKRIYTFFPSLARLAAIVRYEFFVSFSTTNSYVFFHLSLLSLLFSHLLSSLCWYVRLRSFESGVHLIYKRQNIVFAYPLDSIKADRVRNRFVVLFARSLLAWLFSSCTLNTKKIQLNSYFLLFCSAFAMSYIILRLAEMRN